MMIEIHHEVIHQAPEDIMFYMKWVEYLMKTAFGPKTDLERCYINI